MKMARNGEPIEVPIEMIIPRYVVAKERLSLNTQMNVETLKELENFQLSNADIVQRNMKLEDLNNFRIIAVVDYIVKDLLEKERITFELLTYAEPLKDRVFDLDNPKESAYRTAIDCVAKRKGFSNDYLKKRLLPMFPGRKNIKKDYYRCLCFNLDKGIEDIQNRIGCGELFLEDLL